MALKNFLKGISRKRFGRWAAIVAVLGAYVVGALWFSGHTTIYHLYRSSGGAHVSYAKARVLRIEDEVVDRDDSTGLLTGYQDIRARILTGEKDGTELDIRNFLNYTTNIRLKAGDTIIVHVDVADAAHYTVSVYSIDRAPALFLLAFLFVATLCGIGGKRGLRSVLGIIFTFASIVFFFVPMLYRGYSPTLSAALVVVATLCVSLALLGGFGVKTLSAILGSIAGVMVSAILALVFESLTRISGYTTAEADSLLQIAGQNGMKVGELLFAAMLISSLGAIMDVAISVASSVCEVHAANPLLRQGELFRSGLNVGRDMMGAMANTLILVFTGASLNIIILIYSLEHSFYQILNSNAIVIELVQALTGSLAVILTVPAVAFITAALNAGRKSR
jgi:uncharacterized membrane protein